MRQKGFAPILILTLLLVGIASYFAYRNYVGPNRTSLRLYPFSPTTDLSESWKTYTSDKYGFSFKYPQNWDVTQEGRLIPLFHLATTVSDRNYYALDIFIEDETQLGLSDYFQEILGYNEIMLGSESVKSNVLVDSQPAILVTDTFLSGYGEHYNAIYTIYHNKIFSFIAPTNNPYKEMVEEIIATFEFQNTPMEHLYELCDVNKQYYNTFDDLVECYCPKDYVITAIEGSNHMVQCKKWR